MRTPKLHEVSAFCLTALCCLALATPFAVVSAQAQGQTQVPEQVEEIAPQDEKRKRSTDSHAAGQLIHGRVGKRRFCPA